ncbi:MAG: DUF3552 domain-containing protein, partial [Planctomycetota bacterium]
MNVMLSRSLLLAQNSGQVIFVIVLCCLVAGLTLALVKLLDYLRKKDAETEAQKIIEKARQEVEALRRETQLELKEQAIQEKAEREKEFQKIREELHQRERALEKREDA